MRSLSDIKSDLEFNTGLNGLVETLKTIAAAQYKALERKITIYKDLEDALGNFFELIDTKNINHPFLKPAKKKQVIVAITTDAGFLGGLNMHIINAALNELEQAQGSIIVIGKRGKIYMRSIGIPSVSFPGIITEQRYGQAMQLRDYIVKEVLKGSFSNVKVIYPHPVSFTVQRIDMLSLLPYVSSKEPGAEAAIPTDLIMESRPSDVAEYIIRLWIGQKLYNIFGLSRLAEFAARYMHLEESTQKIKDLDKKVRLEYFKVQHELIDRNMRELFAGRLLYAKN